VPDTFFVTNQNFQYGEATDVHSLLQNFLKLVMELNHTCLLLTITYYNHTMYICIIRIRLFVTSVHWLPHSWRSTLMITPLRYITDKMGVVVCCNRGRQFKLVAFSRCHVFYTHMQEINWRKKELGWVGYLNCWLIKQYSCITSI